MEVFLGFLLILACCGVPLVSIIKDDNARKERIKNTKEIYEIKLNYLSNNPENISARKEALEAGRNYYSALRGNNSITTVDETAINNDLFAATGKNNELR